ncbi:hypothetical protein Cob_v010470 [Colletotrichum orbiculare MAFF 240422]|uniref:Uncharacterized protein n=1 Tax=Colletotrichum orbiculare (strain 104-T / ATCC 96160 / CBS 514.97 / LARS 414 / MAFF 240422) TaxID=1213857 RepID=A0A484FI76_COLOR|nr:hypothetical protein Cob_v010470 [Colletotrichum orbiculare MAFF 240422]
MGEGKVRYTKAGLGQAEVKGGLSPVAYRLPLVARYSGSGTLRLGRATKYCRPRHFCDLDFLTEELITTTTG